MTVTVNHAKTNAISDFTQAQLDEQIALGNFAPGTTLADIVLPSDWNDDHTLTGLGTMAEQDANNVAITGGSVNGTTIGATTASTGKFTSVTTPSVTATTTDLTLSAISTGAVKLQTAGGLQMQVANLASTDVYLQARGGQGGVTRPSFGSNYTGATAAGFNIYNTGAQPIRFQTNGNGSEEQFVIASTVSAVNFVQVTGNVTTSAPVISSQGSDTNIALSFVAKGNARHNFFNNSATSSRQFSIGTSGITSAVNFLNVDGSVAGIALPMQAQGTDTNISMAFQPKGTGAIDLAAGSRGVNISNGGTVTAITRTATGSGYATAPTVAISAPTTAGGVQATATCTVTAGAVNTTFTITNAGSGYIEQPTITFSGGGGSGAAAYATVGGNTTVRNLGNTIAFAVPEGTGFAVSGTNSSGGAYWQAFAGTTTPILRAIGTSSGYIQTSSAVPIQFGTNAGTSNAEQFRVSHTASAVNYVQVTGSATGSTVQITAQGSDSVVGLQLVSKSASIIFVTRSGNARSFNILDSASPVNYLQVAGSLTGVAPILSAQGTDTNIDLTLTPKGTGLVRFGTYVAGALLATGYINIKAADGTTYKVLVST